MRNEEVLLARVIDLFARRFDKHAVLRGGMALRILGCERLTNDVDYIFVPYKSKKEIVNTILEALGEIPGAKIRHTLNSKCLRVVVSVEGTSVQIEAKTALQVPTAIQSTATLVAAHGLPPRLVPVEDYPVALAHKMAAWNERRLVRDLYDIWFYLKMGILPEKSVLESRLVAPEYSRLVKKTDHFPSGGDVEAFFAFLNVHARKLTDGDIAASLGDYLTPEGMAGLSMRFRAEMAKLI
jgi:predicted nucleotidyltransferase component of viral defense system